MNRTAMSLFPTILAALVATQPVAAKPVTFRVTLDPKVQQTPFTGRVYVVVSKNLDREPRLSINNWFKPPTIFAQDVENVEPGAEIVIRPSSLTFPPGTIEIEPGEYIVQAIARRSLDHPVPGQGIGDLYCTARRETVDASKSPWPPFRMNRVVQEEPGKETENIKLIEIQSEELTRFHNRPVTMRAAVVLPKGWTDDPKKRHPVLYWIPGFGGNHGSAFRVAGLQRVSENAASVMLVVPDPSCHYGHNVFADSETNGPWGSALINELIPAVEEKFHGPQSGKHRYVAGVSSGGWSSLWLQVTYPDSFAGCWAHTPDPVDFRDFQQINLYESGSNMYKNADGKRRPLARRGKEVMLWYEDFVRHEYALGPGGQIQSFEGCFSRRLPNGQPEYMFDRITGKVNQAVAKSWEKYDIRLVLERNWKELSPKLSGKLHVYGGEVDTFYLEGAVALLKDSLAKLGSDADVRVIPKMGHGLYRDSVEPMFNTITENFARKGT